MGNMTEIERYADAYYSMTWLGPKGYPEQANGGRCYITGLLGMLRFHGETDVLFADGTGGDGFSFRWCPVWGAPAFNGGKGPFHEIWEYIPKSLGFQCHWEEDHEGGWDEAFAKLRDLIDRGVPVQVGVHYSRVWPYGVSTSPRLDYRSASLGDTGFGHHIMVTGYDLDEKTVTVYEPNDIMPHSRYKCPITAFRRGWEEAAMRTDEHYKAWPHHHPWGGTWTLHDGYGPYHMLWVEPGRDPKWDIAASIRDSYRRNIKILRGDYPKPYALFGNQWQIPQWETGAPGMLACAKAIQAGKLKDVVVPGGERHALFVRGNIPNHGVLGRAGAAGYLRRVALELAKRALDSSSVEKAAALMEDSSDHFRELRYESRLARSGEILEQIAKIELAALENMEAGWESVRAITAERLRAERTSA